MKMSGISVALAERPDDMIFWALLRVAIKAMGSGARVWRWKSLAASAYGTDDRSPSWLVVLHHMGCSTSRSVRMSARDIMLVISA